MRSPLGMGGWTERFLDAMANHPEGRVPMDFFSWHTYGTNPAWMGETARRIRASASSTPGAT